MEYSPMMVFMLWALTPSDCLPTDGELTEQARVVEIPQPIMSVHPEAYFTFNHGRPFLAERDPLTGAIDSNIKTTPVTGDDYFYEEYEESGESIDRKDSASKIFTRNDITSTSKDSDLHKFLNLPVHYSSSGKFPLISSSYANTKVQGHGPLSNHKLYTSSTSTSTTVSPSYYTLKTKSTTTERLSTTTKATTTPSTTTSTVPPTQRTTTTTPPSTTKTTTKPPRATVPSTTKTTTTTTTTMKPLLSNYDYDYEYDYDKNDGSENSSHDYEFLGSSAEVTSSYERHSTTVTPIKLTTTQKTTKEPTIAVQHISTESSPTTTTKKTELPNEETSRPTVPSKTEKPSNHTSTKYQEDTFDLKPPKPAPSIELKPPQFHPTRPFSSVVPTKPQTYAPSGFVRYPESPILFGDKKPFTVYSPQNITRSQPAINPTTSQLSEDKKRHEDEKQTSSSQSTPQAVQSHLVQKKPLNEYSTEPNMATTITMAQNHNKTETAAEKINEIKKPLLQDNKEISDVSDKPVVDKPTQINHQLIQTEKPLESHKIPYGVIKRPEAGSERPHSTTQQNKHEDYKRPQSTTQQNKHEDLLADHKRHQEIPVRPQEYRPQGSHEMEHNFQGMSPSGANRPPPDHRHQQPPQLHYKPQDSPQEIPQSQRPQDSIPDHTRLPINLKPDPTRLQISHLPSNKKPLIHLPPEHNIPPNYQWLEYNRPPSTFGLRITERPIVPDRIPNVDHLRPPGKPQVTQFESIKPGSGLEVRPHQGLAGGEVRPIESNHGTESNQKPFIFAKPQSGKRPDFNTVQFGQPSKIENHFISVSPGNDNPSYSLQTSFSIGVPPPEQKQTPSGSSHGVGQVLFPDEETEKRPAAPVWPHQRPPQVSQSDVLPNIQGEKYPRPPWESHLKPPFIYHKKEQFPPIKRKPLPNILPQFRPNAKIGHAEPHVYLKPREPYDTLQPPPLPRPQFLRLEQDVEETKPLVHRRNGQSSSSRVTTLQMMQAAPSSKRAALRADDTNEKNEPVFVVYPSNGNNGPAPPSGGVSDGVVVGTRGPQRPLPPDNLDIEDDLDSFPLDNNKNFQARVDTPVLKSKPPTSKPPIKNEFPYTLIKPTAEERIITPESVNTKEYTAFSPTMPSTEKDNDAEINIIPYLQDYMPFATKKPAQKEPWLLHNSVPSKEPSIEITPSTTYKNDNHREVISEGPQPQDFQAPFHASLTAPSQGWSVVQKKPNNEKNNEELTTNKELNEVQTTEEPKFDIQNFKPQLFGGFKPIVPPLDNEKKES